MVSDIPRSLRSTGVGYSRFLHITSSKDAPRRSCLSVRRNSPTIPSEYPLAIVPCSAIVSVASITDIDRVHCMPTLDEVTKMLPNGFSELAETVALALFLSMQGTYKPFVALSSTAWFHSQAEGTAKSPSRTQATALLFEMEEAVAEFHAVYSTHHNSPSLISLLRLWRFVLSSRCEMIDPSSFASPSATTDPGTSDPPLLSCVVPLIDLLVARRGQPNVMLTLSTAKELRAERFSNKERQEVCDFFGGWQRLYQSDGASRYFTLVSTRDMQAGDELCLEGLPDQLSLLDEIRGGF